MGDRSFYGVYAALGPLLGDDVALDTYLLGLQTHDTLDPVTGAVVPWSLLVHVGGRFRHRVEQLDLRAEAGLQLGRNGAAPDAPAILAGAAEGEVGLNLLGDRVRLALRGLYASGDDASTSDLDERYDPLFPRNHPHLGMADVMGPRSNIAAGVLRVLVEPLDPFRVGLDVHVFARPEAPGDQYAGTEGDLLVLWLPGEGVRVHAMYALYLPNAGFWAAPEEPVHFFELEVGYRLPP